MNDAPKDLTHLPVVPCGMNVDRSGDGWIVDRDDAYLPAHAVCDALWLDADFRLDVRARAAALARRDQSGVPVLADYMLAIYHALQARGGAA